MNINIVIEFDFCYLHIIYALIRNRIHTYRLSRRKVQQQNDYIEQEVNKWKREWANKNFSPSKHFNNEQLLHIETEAHTHTHVSRLQTLLLENNNKSWVCVNCIRCTYHRYRGNDFLKNFYIHTDVSAICDIFALCVFFLSISWRVLEITKKNTEEKRKISSISLNFSILMHCV